MGKRERGADLDVDLEITKTDTYEICGGIGDFLPKESNEPGCHQVKHFKGDVVTVEGGVQFSLEGDDGWQDDIGRHWYGDQLREIE